MQGVRAARTGPKHIYDANKKRPAKTEMVNGVSATTRGLPESFQRVYLKPTLVQNGWTRLDLLIYSRLILAAESGGESVAKL